MRDPERIDPILARLARVWKQNPELRLGQLILNACLTPDRPDIYYIEDSVLIQSVENFPPYRRDTNGTS